MRKSSPKMLAGKPFNTKTALEQYVSGMLNRATPGESLIAEDALLLHELFSHHPDYMTKTRGEKIIRFFRAPIRKEHGSGFTTVPGFHFETAGGITDDFSIGKSIKSFWSKPTSDT